MKNQARQQIPPPTIVAPRSDVEPTKPAEVVPRGTGIELIEPTIQLMWHLFVFDPKTGKDEQTDVLKPSRAVLVDGAVVIDEMSLIVPLARCFIRTKRS